MTYAEEWKTVQGFPSYEVSNRGRVRRLAAVYAGRSRKSLTYPAGYVLAHRISSSGYPSVWLRSDGRKGVNKLVSRLVCEAFHGPCPADNYDAAHWDGDVLNCSYLNLRWATKKENSADQARHGTKVMGEKIWTAKLTREDIPIIRGLARNGISYREISEQFFVGQSTIKDIIKEVTWAWVVS